MSAHFPVRALASRRAIVVGLARSGVAACRFLVERGARVVGADRRPLEALGGDVASLGPLGVELALGGPDPDLRGFDIVVLSPGVDPRQEFVARARSAGVPIVGELELGAAHARGRVVAVTGTKGKSTTCAALAAMLRAAGRDARAVGNIGEPITAHAGSTTDETILVVEASSFQLEIAEGFDPRTVVFLNLFPDHLDRHASFEEYAVAKARIFRNQKASDVALVNAESDESARAARTTRARILPFRPRTPPADAERPVAAFAGAAAVLRGDDAAADAILFRANAVKIPGAHARGNLLAAAAAARIEGAGPEAIEAAVAAFQGLPNAFERLGDARGVVFINDSKATTVDSVIEALASCDAPVIAILGGRLKAGSFEAIRENGAAVARLKAVCAIGESRDLVRRALQKVCPVELCASMDEAVDRAVALAKPGDIVLLSPGCASFDMFASYAARGDAFRRAFDRVRKVA